MLFEFALLALAVESLPHLFSELLDAEWLGQECHSRVQYPIVDNSIASVTGGEDHLQAGLEFDGPIGCEGGNREDSHRIFYRERSGPSWTCRQS